MATESVNQTWSGAINLVFLSVSPTHSISHGSVLYSLEGEKKSVLFFRMNNLIISIIQNEMCFYSQVDAEGFHSIKCISSFYLSV